MSCHTLPATTVPCATCTVACPPDAFLLLYSHYKVSCSGGCAWAGHLGHTIGHPALVHWGHDKPPGAAVDPDHIYDARGTWVEGGDKLGGGGEGVGKERGEW